MSSVNKTPHYNLSQFGDDPSDKPSWRGDYTGDMSKIDTALYNNQTAAAAAQSTATTANEAAQAASTAAANGTSMFAAMGIDNTSEATAFLNRVEGVETKATAATDNLAALGVTNTSQAQSLLNTINGKAEQTTVSALQSQLNAKANAADVYTQTQSDGRYVQNGGYEGTAQTLNTLITQNASDIDAAEGNIKTIQAFVKEFSDSTNWTKNHYAAESGAFNRDIYLFANETLQMFRLYGIMSMKNTTNGGRTVECGPIIMGDAQKIPESMRPSTAYTIRSVGIAYSVQPSNYSLAPLIASVDLKINTDGTALFSYALGGTSSNQYQTTVIVHPQLHFAQVHA